MNENKKDSRISQPPNFPTSDAAFLWDESFLWGVMAYKALQANGLAFDLLTSSDIRNGCLNRYKMLFVPGGWASNKIKALGDQGVELIRNFVREGGSYLGFCGGAGLATMDGMGLLPVKRRPTKERVPSFSGRIMLNPEAHQIWKGIPSKVFHAWWPSQFVVDEGVTVLARYGPAMPDSFSSDINVGDAQAYGKWDDLERIYGINLDPKRLLGEPAVIEGRFGKGRIFLSLVHFDTPDDSSGAAALRNVWEYLGGSRDAGDRVQEPGDRGQNHETRGQGAGNREQEESDPSVPLSLLAVSQRTVADLVALGERNFLWYWRNPMLLQWRRGVRGLEYCTLFIMLHEICRLIERGGGDQQVLDQTAAARIRLFADKAGLLLVRERQAMQSGNITYERCDAPDIQSLREELFSRSKSHGGMFKEVLDSLDGFLFDLLSGRSRPGKS